VAQTVPAIVVSQAIDAPPGTELAEGFLLLPLAIVGAGALDADAGGQCANGAAASDAIFPVGTGRDAGMVFEAAALAVFAVVRREALDAPLVLAERPFFRAVGKGVASP
jgi:hypothetical protein